MNWLAHAFLSKPDIDFRLGNLLADLVKPRDHAGLTEAFLEGVRRHQAIDAFTDSHPIVARSRSRIGPDFRRVAGILVDVFYDHFLALDWERYAAEPLDAFTGRLYADVRARAITLPEEPRIALERVVADDRLGSYRRLDGIEAALRRVSERLQERTGRDLALHRGVSELVSHFDDLHADFAEFFPQLQAFVADTDAAPTGARPTTLAPDRLKMTTIRRERPDDATAIHAVHAQSFPTEMEARLVKLLRAAGRLTVSLVAEVDGLIVGHVAVSQVTTASSAVGGGIAPVAVTATHRRNGIGAALIRAALDACPAAGFHWAVVLGDPAYYGRFGFHPATEFGLTDEYNGGSAFQSIELTPGRLPRNAGLVQYVPEFASLE